jgi:hypothetical protein
MVFGPNGFVGSLMFTTQRITIGRDPAAMVRLDDPSVSLKHAVLQIEGDHIQLQDVGSRTGTRVNGAPASADPVRATDEIGVGVFKLRLSIHRPEAAGFGGQRHAPGISNLVMPTPMAEFEVPRREPEKASAPPAEAKTSERPAARRTTARPAALGGRMGPRIVPKQPPSAPPPEPEPPAPPSVPLRDSVDELLNAVSEPPPDRPQREEVRAARPMAVESPAKAARPMAAESPAKAARPIAQEPAKVARAVAVEPVRAPRSTADEPTQTAPFVLPVVPSRPRDPDDDEDDDEDFVPAFDLLQSLSQAGLRAGAAPGPTTVEVVQFRDDRVINVRHVEVGESLLLQGGDVEFGARRADGTFVLYPAACGELHVSQGGRPVEIPEDAKRSSESALRLVAGMQVTFDVGSAGEQVLVQLVSRAAPVPLPAMSFKPTPDRVAPPIFSAAVHLVLFAIIAFAILGGKKDSEIDPNAGRFATISVKELEMEPPPPPPPPPPVDETPPPPDAPVMPATKHPTTHAKSDTPAVPQQTAAQRESAASTSKILSALGGSAAPNAINVAAITNIDAVPHGTGGFKVSGVVGKVPGDQLRVAGSSDSQINTKSAAELGAVGQVHAKTGPDVVRGRVTGAPPALQGEGHLSRGEIQRVINAHIYQVQGCYERQLLKDPSLAGKVSFQWVISPSGAVSGVRVGQSSLRSGEVTSCIQAAIQGWMFPQPEGGSVTVTYPFSFIGN